MPHSFAAGFFMMAFLTVLSPFFTYDWCGLIVAMRWCATFSFARTICCTVCKVSKTVTTLSFAFIVSADGGVHNGGISFSKQRGVIGICAAKFPGVTGNTFATPGPKKWPLMGLKNYIWVFNSLTLARLEPKLLLRTINEQKTFLVILSCYIYL